MTLQDFLELALLEIGAISIGDPMTSDQARIGMLRLNMGIDSWNADRLKIYSIQQWQFPLTSALTYKMGATQVLPNFTMPRPTRIETVNLLINNGTTVSRTPVAILNASQWSDPNLIAVPQIPNGFPTVCYPDYAFIDDGSRNPVNAYSNISFWTGPGAGQSIELWTFNQLPQFSTMQDVVEFPPAYAQTLLLSAAVWLAPSFGCEPSATTMENLRLANAKLAGLNLPDMTMTPATGFPGGSRGDNGMWNPYSGTIGNPL